MIVGLGTVLTALYAELTDRIIPSRGFTRCGPGVRLEVTGAERAYIRDSAPRPATIIMHLTSADPPKNHLDSLI